MKRASFLLGVGVRGTRPKMDKPTDSQKLQLLHSPDGVPYLRILATSMLTYTKVKLGTHQKKSFFLTRRNFLQPLNGEQRVSAAVLAFLDGYRTDPSTIHFEGITPSISRLPSIHTARQYIANCPKTQYQDCLSVNSRTPTNVYLVAFVS